MPQGLFPAFLPAGAQLMRRAAAGKLPAIGHRSAGDTAAGKGTAGVVMRRAPRRQHWHCTLAGAQNAVRLLIWLCLFFVFINLIIMRLGSMMDSLSRCLGPVRVLASRPSCNTKKICGAARTASLQVLIEWVIEVCAIEVRLAGPPVGRSRRIGYDLAGGSASRHRGAPHAALSRSPTRSTTVSSRERVFGPRVAISARAAHVIP